MRNVTIFCYAMLVGLFAFSLGADYASAGSRKCASSGSLSTFNYKEDDPKDYARARKAFMDEYEKVVDYLGKKEPSNMWGVSDAHDLWDYRQSNKKSFSDDNPDNYFVVIREMGANEYRFHKMLVKDLAQDMADNPEYYTIRFLMVSGTVLKMLTGRGSGTPWNPVSHHEKGLAKQQLRDVVNRLKQSGSSVELAMAEFQKIKEDKIKKSLETALDYAKYKINRMKKLIKTRKYMRKNGLLKPAKIYVNGKELKEVVIYYNRNYLKKYFDRYNERKKFKTDEPRIDKRYTYYEDGGIKLKHGCYESWHEEGNRFEMIDYNHGEMHGERYNYQSNLDGSNYLSFYQQFKNGKNHGVHKSYYSDGRLRQVQNWKDGKQNGWETVYNVISGKYLKSRKTHYKDGEYDGESFMWNTNGALQKNITWKNSRETYAKYYSKGKLAAHGPMGKGRNRCGAWKYYPIYKNEKLRTVDYGPCK